MPVTTAPSEEACAALVTRLNTGGAYTLPTPAAYTELADDCLDEVTDLTVDVVHLFQQHLDDETLDIENPTSHIIRVWVRKQLANIEPATVAPLNLIVQQIFQRLNNFDSADKRVRVWEIGKDRGEIPGKLTLLDNNLFRSYVELRVEVAPSP